MVHKKLNRTKGKERSKRRSRVKRTKVKRSTMKQHTNKKTRTTPKTKKRSMRKMKGSNTSRRSILSSRSTSKRRSDKRIIGGVWPATPGGTGEPTSGTEDNPMHKRSPGPQLQRQKRENLKTKQRWDNMTEDMGERFKGSVIDLGQNLGTDGGQMITDAGSIVSDTSKGLTRLGSVLSGAVRGTVSSITKWSPNDDFAFNRVKGAFKDAVRSLSNKIIRRFLKKFVTNTNADTGGTIDGHIHLTDIGADLRKRRELWDSISMKDKTIFMHWIELIQPFFNDFLLTEQQTGQPARDFADYQRGLPGTSRSANTPAFQTDGSRELGEDTKKINRLTKRYVMEDYHMETSGKTATDEELVWAENHGTDWSALRAKLQLDGVSYNKREKWKRLYTTARAKAAGEVEQAREETRNAKASEELDIRTAIIKHIKTPEWIAKNRDAAHIEDPEELRQLLGLGGEAGKERWYYLKENWRGLEAGEGIPDEEEEDR